MMWKKIHAIFRSQAETARSHRSANLRPQIHSRDWLEMGGKVPLSEQRLPDEKTFSFFNGSIAAITDIFFSCIRSIAFARWAVKVWGWPFPSRLQLTCNWGFLSLLSASPSWPGQFKGSRVFCPGLWVTAELLLLSSYLVISNNKVHNVSTL